AGSGVRLLLERRSPRRRLRPAAHDLGELPRPADRGRRLGLLARPAEDARSGGDVRALDARRSEGRLPDAPQERAPEVGSERDVQRHTVSRAAARVMVLSECGDKVAALKAPTLSAHSENYPGGHPKLRPPMTCAWMWNTVWPA